MKTMKSRLALMLGLMSAALLMVVAVNTFTHTGKSYIRLHAIPEDAVLRVNNEVTSSGLWLKPGTYIFSAAKNGYETDSQTIAVSSTTTDLYFVPRPVSEEAKKSINSVVVSEKREMYAGLKAAIVGQSISDTNPLIELLPKYDIAGPYTIDYGLDENSQAYYVIGNSTASGRKNALQWIRDVGYNPSELDIQFSDFTNPTTGERE